jgi:hypothetical protein
MISNFRVPNTPFTITFYREKTFDTELKKWIYGPYPSGTVSATSGYQQDANTPVPFRFS